MLLFSYLGAIPADAASLAPFPRADRVVVSKSDRKLHLYQGDRILKSFEISLGKNPVGPKRRRGDARTPEGRYLLDWRNSKSRFHLAIHISYPNHRDRLLAEEAGVPPGEDIMIHGLPNRFGEEEEFFQGRDWTEGCIAVANDDMEEIWQLVANNTMIEINP